MQLRPYIFFYGRCQEALDFYTKIFGGNYEAMRNADAPADVKEHMPPGSENGVMHASFTSDKVAFMCSDGRDVKAIDPDAGNISLALTVSTAEGERVFNALADGGKVTMPFADAFWGGKFGMVNDRFGNEWMINAE
jgi:PhnB protein